MSNDPDAIRDQLRTIRQRTQDAKDAAEELRRDRWSKMHEARQAQPPLIWDEIADLLGMTTMGAIKAYKKGDDAADDDEANVN